MDKLDKCYIWHIITLATMRNKLRTLKGGRNMPGKHTEAGVKIRQLEEIIQRKDKEIKDIKFSIADILLQIRTINRSNEYGDPSIKKRKISELCTDTRYELLIDELKDSNEKAKIIELPTNHQVSK